MGVGQAIGIVIFIVCLYFSWQVRQVLLLVFSAIVIAVALNRLVRVLSAISHQARHCDLFIFDSFAASSSWIFSCSSATFSNPITRASQPSPARIRKVTQFNKLATRFNSRASRTRFAQLGRLNNCDRGCFASLATS